jgi:hypothetical protein
MMKPVIRENGGPGDQPRRAGFTLAEVVMAMAIAMVVFAGIIGAYIHGCYRAEWAGYSLAAQALAIQQIEQAKSAKWDIQDVPIVNEITNLPAVTASQLDLPISGTNVTWATNFISVMSLTNGPVSYYFVRVDTVWPFFWRNQVTYYTNTVADYFAPE